MTRILIVDDMETRHDSFRGWLPEAERVHVYNYDQAVKALQGDKFDVVYLDHDLSEMQTLGLEDSEQSGYDVALYISKLKATKKPGRVVIHTWNPVGARRIAEVLHAAKISFVRQPFGPQVVLV